MGGWPFEHSVEQTALEFLSLLGRVGNRDIDAGDLSGLAALHVPGGACGIYRGRT